LALNDNKIKEYCMEYEELRHGSNLNKLNRNEVVILKSIINGLEDMNINPMEILGLAIYELVGRNKKNEKYN
jgi:hypothetical protein